jgi:hypothetical protein
MWGMGQAASGAGRAAAWGADKSMQGLKNTATNYEKWRDPVSRVNNATKAIDQVIAAYGQHRVDGGMTVERILGKMKMVLANVRQSIESEKSAPAAAAPVA